MRQIQEQQIQQLQQVQHLQFLQELAQQQSSSFAEAVEHASAENEYDKVPQARRVREFHIRRKLSNEQLYEATGFTRRERKYLLRLIGRDLQRRTNRSQPMTPLQILIVAMRVLRSGDELWNCGFFVGISHFFPNFLLLFKILRCIEIFCLPRSKRILSSSSHSIISFNFFERFCKTLASTCNEDVEKVQASKCCWSS